MRKYLLMSLLLVLMMSGVGGLPPAAQASDTGDAAPLTGRIVSDEPGTSTPNILDGTVYSIAKVGNTIVVGGQFTQVRNYNSSATLTRRNVMAFDATTGKLSTTFAPDPDGIVYKVLPAADGRSVYVAGDFRNAAGRSVPGRLLKIDVSAGVVDPTFTAAAVTGEIRDLDLVGNHLFLAGKFTHVGGIAQKGLATEYADTGKRDPYFNAMLAGLHNPALTTSVTDVLQISVNKQRSQLVAVGNFTTVDGQARSQIVKFDVANLPAGVDGTAHQSLSTWSTNVFTTACSPRFDTYMTDVEFSPDGSYFIVSTTGGYGGSGSNAGTVGCDVVARFEGPATTSATPATWTAYTGGDTTWTVEVTDNVVYTGGHMRWQNNPTAGNTAGQGAVSREGIAALNPVNGMPYSWNPTRARGIGVQDMLATTDGLYVGSDTELIGHTVGNTYHARIAVLPLAGGAALPAMQATSLPVDVYRVASLGSQLTRRSFTGSTVGTSANVPTGPGWSTSVGAFMVNGVLYKANSDGSLSKMTFDGSTYGTLSAVNTADALVAQSDWHTDVTSLTSLFYSGGFLYYTKSGVNALYRRGFEVEDGVVGQQRFSTTTTAVNWSNARGAFVAGGKLYYATTLGALVSATWDQARHNTSGAATTVTTAGSGWASRAMFPMQAAPVAVNQPPVASASVSCLQLVCTFDGTRSTDPENAALTYDWDFGDGTAHGTGATTSHTYATAGDRPVTLVVTDNKGATNSTSRTASPISHADTLSFVGSSNNNGSRSVHTITVPSGTQIGDTLLLFFTANSPTPVFTGPSGWTQVLEQKGTNELGKVYTRTATASDLGAGVTVTSKNSDGTAATIKSDLTLAAYRGAGSPAVAVAVSTSQNVATVVHQTPKVTATTGTSWLLSFWSDKSSTTTGWTAPAGQTQRSTGNATGTSHVSSLLTDSNARVSSGGQGGLNASAEPASSAQGLTMSILLDGQPAPPADAPATARIAYVGSASTSGNRTVAAVTLPSGVQAGDTMVLFFGAAVITSTYTVSAGWTLLESKDGTSAMAARAWTRTATAADAAGNVKVSVTASAIAKSDLTVAVYRNTDGTAPIAVSASKIDNVAGAAHTSPAVTSTGDTSWLATYWADRSNTSTTLAAPTGPGAPTVRAQGLPSDTGSAHVVALLADSNGPVAAGAQGQLTATANGDSSRGASFSILLRSN